MSAINIYFISLFHTHIYTLYVVYHFIDTQTHSFPHYLLSDILMHLKISGVLQWPVGA